MLEGMVEVWLDEVKRHHLERGDRFWFQSNRGHCCSTHRQAGSCSLGEYPTRILLMLLSASETQPQRELLDSRDAKSSSIEAESEAAVIGRIVEGGIRICVEAD